MVDFLKPATILFEKIANALGRHFDPSQTIRIAIAEADASEIRAKGDAKAHRALELSKAETDIEVTALRQRAATRFINEEMKKQVNMEDIAENAAGLLTDNASPENMEDDWITNFFDKCRIVSDGQMQNLWSRILAGEANNPGSFSRRTVNLMADLDKQNAGLFSNLCRFNWRLENQTNPLIFDTQHEIYNRLLINFGSVGHLETLGLIQVDGLGGFNRTRLQKTATFHYYGRSMTLTFPTETGNELDIGHVLFTQAGRELSRICTTAPIEGFFDYVCDKWSKDSKVLSMSS